MNDALDRPIRKFNPGTFQSDDEVVRQFVVRQEELDLVLEVMRGNTDSPSCQHVLVVGPRGRGKTMLLARVGAELRTDNALSERLFPVRFMEESQEIATLADFWLEAMFHLAHANATGSPEFSRELLATHADLTARWRDTNIEERARAAFLEAADRLDRRVVLMVENLQALCSDVGDDFGWRLRETLQSEPRLMLLATATSRFKGLDDAQRPFFELFRIVELEPLSTEACRRLWNMVSGDEQTNRQITPLRILTGGSPRLLVIVATFARHRSLRQLLEDLVTLVDDHTEYFRSHLEVLAKTERRVYLAVIDLWQSSSAQEIAARARLDIRTASALIARLVDRGAVVAEGAGRKRRYAAAERLYSIYYKLRRERDEAGLVRNLIQFMTVFYRSDELAEMMGTWRLEAADSPAIREGLDQALAGGAAAPSGFGANDPLQVQTEVASAASGATNLRVWTVRKLVNKSITHVQHGEYEAALAAYDELFARLGDSVALELQIAVARGLLLKGITHVQRGDHEGALAAYTDLIARFDYSAAPELRAAVAEALVNKGTTHNKRGEHNEALADYGVVVARFGDSDTPALQVAVAKALVNEGIVHDQCGEHEAELAAYENSVRRFGDSDIPELRAEVAKALMNKGITHRQRGEHRAALAVYSDLVARFGDSDNRELQVMVAKVLVNKIATHVKHGEEEAALAVYEDLVARFGGSTMPELQVQVGKALVNKGIAHGQRGEHQAAQAASDEVIARFSNRDTPELQVQVAKALLNKGITHSQRGETQAELAAYEDSVARFGDGDAPELLGEVAKALLNKGITHDQRGEHGAALAAYDDLVARFGNSDTPELRQSVASALVCRGHQQIATGRAEDALHSSNEFDRRFDEVIDNESGTLAVLRWRAKWMRMHALLVLNEHPAALSVFQSVCAMFVVGNEAMLREMLERVPILIAAGAPERDLVAILSADSQTADALAPLVVALRQLAGEPVRAPAEVLEVAADICKNIEEAKRLGAGRRTRNGNDS